MRRSAIVMLVVLLGLAALGLSGIAGAHAGCTVGVTATDGHICFPTPTECATGAYNGNWPGSTTYPTPYRGATCVGGMGTIAFYAGGNGNALCGYIIAGDQELAQSGPADPNGCP